jgi:hypothetical protein
MKISHPIAPQQENADMAQVYIVEGELLGPGLGEVHHHGETFSSDDEQLVKQLLKAGALKYPSEALSPQDISAQLARLAELEAMLASAKAAEAQGAPVAEDEPAVEAEIEEIKRTARGQGRGQ